jgi:mannosylglycerate hydrolase
VSAPVVPTLLVSHFHWDREWYRTFEDYRGRLVDAIDRVLDLVAADPEFRFVLDGQAILLEDYVAVRPARRAALEAGLRSGRLAAGPWYVQPDVLLPSGESLVRNLLLGRAVAAAFGPVSRAGYVPDSFGHPAQLPQLLAGFGIESFIYWRGNGGEIDALPTPYRWTAPDGSAVRAFHLQDGYFGAACLADDARAVDTLVSAARRHAAAGAEPVVLMNGFDHMLPDATVTRVAGRLGAALGAPVRCALLDDVAAALPVATGEHRGELLGGRLANLLPGVWSTRMPQKIRNRRCETLLTGWLEPWAAIGHALGLPDERASIAAAWRTLVQNHAHDSICGCSLDAVAARVDARFDEVEGLGEATLARILDRLAGQGPARRTPWTDAPEIVVFNPSPHARTDVVRVSLDAYPAMRMPLGLPEFAPLALAASDPPGFTHDGRALRVVAADDPARVRWLPGQTPFDVELLVTDVPAFGVRRLRLEPAERVPDVVDDGRKIETDRVRVEAAGDGTLAVTIDGHAWRGLAALEDVGDRGDSYDFDPVEGDVEIASVACRRRRHPSGLAALEVRRVLRVPRALDEARAARAPERVDVTVVVEASVAPGVARVDLRVRVENAARDHRLRLRFPTGRPAAQAYAATTFDVAVRPTAPRDAAGWVHPAPATFPHQGFVVANGLMVVAPGLPEAEVTPDGEVAITLVRAVGWIARYDLRTRPMPAGPAMAIDGAQTLVPFEARLALLADGDPVAARDAELGLRGTIGGPEPLVADGRALLALEPRSLVLSAVKPAEEGSGIVVRVVNPTDTAVDAVLACDFPSSSARAVRLDETPDAAPVAVEGTTVRCAVPPRALRSMLLA